MDIFDDEEKEKRAFFLAERIETLASELSEAVVPHQAVLVAMRDLPDYFKKLGAAESDAEKRAARLADGCEAQRTPYGQCDALWMFILRQMTLRSQLFTMRARVLSSDISDWLKAILTELDSLLAPIGGSSGRLLKEKKRLEDALEKAEGNLRKAVVSDMELKASVKRATPAEAAKLAKRASKAEETRVAADAEVVGIKTAMESHLRTCVQDLSEGLNDADRWGFYRSHISFLLLKRYYDLNAATLTNTATMPEHATLALSASTHGAFAATDTTFDLQYDRAARGVDKINALARVCAAAPGLFNDWQATLNAFGAKLRKHIDSTTLALPETGATHTGCFAELAKALKTVSSMAVRDLSSTAGPILAAIATSGKTFAQSVREVNKSFEDLAKERAKQTDKRARAARMGDKATKIESDYQAWTREASAVLPRVLSTIASCEERFEVEVYSHLWALQTLISNAESGILQVFQGWGANVMTLFAEFTRDQSRKLHEALPMRLTASFTVADSQTPSFMGRVGDPTAAVEAPTILAANTPCILLRRHTDGWDLADFDGLAFVVPDKLLGEPLPTPAISASLKVPASGAGAAASASSGPRPGGVGPGGGSASMAGSRRGFEAIATMAAGDLSSMLSSLSGLALPPPVTPISGLDSLGSASMSVSSADAEAYSTAEMDDDEAADAALRLRLRGLSETGGVDPAAVAAAVGKRPPPTRKVTGQALQPPPALDAPLAPPRPVRRADAPGGVAPPPRPVRQGEGGDMAAANAEADRMMMSMARPGGPAPPVGPPRPAQGAGGATPMGLSTMAEADAVLGSLAPSRAPVGPPRPNTQASPMGLSTMAEADAVLGSLAPARSPVGPPRPSTQASPMGLSTMAEADAVLGSLAPSRAPVGPPRPSTQASPMGLSTMAEADAVLGSLAPSRAPAPVGPPRPSTQASPMGLSTMAETDAVLGSLAPSRAPVGPPRPSTQASPMGLSTMAEADAVLGSLAPGAMAKQVGPPRPRTDSTAAAMAEADLLLASSLGPPRPGGPPRPTASSSANASLNTMAEAEAMLGSFGPPKPKSGPSSMTGMTGLSAEEEAAMMMASVAPPRPAARDASDPALGSFRSSKGSSSNMFGDLAAMYEKQKAEQAAAGTPGSPAKP